MSHNYTSIYFHTVWGTQKRRPLILPNVQKRLYLYIATVLKSKKCKLLAFGGVHDHIHLLFSMNPTLSTSSLIRNLKSNSSRFAAQINEYLTTFEWQRGYSLFSVSPSMIQTVRNYIFRQAEHHVSYTFKEELEFLMQRDYIVKQVTAPRRLSEAGANENSPT